MRTIILAKAGGTTLRIGNNIVSLRKLIGLALHLSQTGLSESVKCYFPDFDKIIGYGIIDVKSSLYRNSIDISSNYIQVNQLVSRLIATKPPSPELEYSSYSFGNTSFLVFHDLRRMHFSSIVNAIGQFNHNCEELVVIMSDPYPLDIEGLEDCVPSIDNAVSIPANISDIYSAFRSWAGNSLIVGIHMRKKDYRRWQNGKHFYEDCYYARLASSIESSFAPLNPKFIIVSDEPFDPFIDQEQSCESFFDCNNSVSVLQCASIDCIDLIKLSMCDLIVGPVSTYSQLAFEYRILYNRIAHHRHNFVPSRVVLTGCFETDMSLILQSKSLDLK